MGRRKKEENILEVPTEMTEDAMNIPEEKNEKEPFASNTIEKNSNSLPILKKVSCSASAVNVRDSHNGNILFTIKNNTKILIENEEDGWCKITGYIMADLIQDI